MPPFFVGRPLPRLSGRLPPYLMARWRLYACERIDLRVALCRCPRLAFADCRSLAFAMPDARLRARRSRRRAVPDVRSRAGAADLRAGGQAGRAGGGQCLCRPDGEQQAIPSSTIRSSASSSAAGDRASGAAVAGLRRDRRADRAWSSPTITWWRAAPKSGRARPTSANSRPRSCSRPTRTDLAVLKIEAKDEQASGARLRRLRRVCRWATWCWRSAIRSASARP